MAKYKNKRLHISFAEIIIAIIFVVITLGGLFFQKEYGDIKALFNIERTFVDYIITAPSKEQVVEIQEQEGMKAVVPYIYRSVEIGHHGKVYESSLYVIENAEDIKYTTFSDELRISGTIPSELNTICVSYDLAKNLGIKVEDNISVSVQNTELTFRVAGIYESDYRSVGGMLLTEFNGEIEELLGSEYKYNGAYLCSDNTALTDDYVEKYVPLGDLRTREDFESDEAYDIYLKDRETSDYSKMIFYTDNYLKEIENRNTAKMNRQIILAIMSYIVIILVVVVLVFVKTNTYIRKDLLRDVRNNYTIKQEKEMFKYYVVSVLGLVLLSEIVGLTIGYFALGTVPNVLLNGLVIVIAIVLILLCNGIMQVKITHNYEEIKAKIKDKEKEVMQV